MDKQKSWKNIHTSSTTHTYLAGPDQSNDDLRPFLRETLISVPLKLSASPPTGSFQQCTIIIGFLTKQIKRIFANDPTTNEINADSVIPVLFSARTLCLCVNIKCKQIQGKSSKSIT